MGTSVEMVTGHAPFFPWTFAMTATVLDRFIASPSRPSHHTMVTMDQTKGMVFGTEDSISKGVGSGPRYSWYW